MAATVHLEERDCPECHSAGSVRGNLCEVCYAELDEYASAAGGAVDLPPAAPPPTPAAGPG